MVRVLTNHSSKWQHLLQENRFKEVIVQALRTLSESRLIDVFAFIIRPTHIHLIWRKNYEINENNFDFLKDVR